jgi:hypothetical protein
MAERSGGKARAAATTPRWVKLSAGAACVLLLLFVALLLAGHNPARHFALPTSISPAAPGVDGKP